MLTPEIMQKLGAHVGQEVEVASTSNSRTTQSEATATPEVARNIIANDALVRFAHSGYRGRRALCAQLGVRIDEATMRLVVVNLLYAAVQDAAQTAASAHPDAGALPISRFALALRARFASALRAAMRDDAQPEIQAWACAISEQDLATWRATPRP